MNVYQVAVSRIREHELVFEDTLTVLGKDAVSACTKALRVCTQRKPRSAFSVTKIACIGTVVKEPSASEQQSDLDASAHMPSRGLADGTHT